MKKYKLYKNKYNKIALLDFNKKLKDILEQTNLTKEESDLRRNYYRYTPLKRNKSIMNILAMYVEGIEFDNKWSKSNNTFDYKVLMNNKNFTPNKNIVKSIRDELKQFYIGFKNISIFENNTEEVYGEEYEYENTYVYLFEYLEQKLNSIISNRKELCDYVIYTVYNHYKTYSKNLLWNIFGDTIVDNLRLNSEKYFYPCQSENGVEYLGKKYTMKEGVVDKII